MPRMDADYIEIFATTDRIPQQLSVRSKPGIRIDTLHTMDRRKR